MLVLCTVLALAHNRIGSVPRPYARPNTTDATLPSTTCNSGCIPEHTKLKRGKSDCCTEGHETLECPKPAHFRCGSPPPPVECTHWSDCPDATHVIIPNGTTTINNSAFLGSQQLLTVQFPQSLTSIGARAFDSCSSLLSIHLPDGVASIGESAFVYSISLSSINIPENTTIGHDAFAGCFCEMRLFTAGASLCSCNPCPSSTLPLFD
jgi:hypothetical protein